MIHRNKQLYSKNTKNFYISSYICPYCGERAYKSVFPLGGEYSKVGRNAANILEFLKTYCKMTDCTGIKRIVVLPYITKSEWIRKRFESYAFLPPIMFKDDFKSKKVFLKNLITFLINVFKND